MPDEHDNDATRAALDRIAKDGSNLGRPLVMDFFVAVPDATIGRTIAARAARVGFETSVEKDFETQRWTCYCTKILVPTFSAVVAIERQLQVLADDLGGYSDGFGTFGNAQPQ